MIYNQSYKTISIFGPGLLGGSLALAIRKYLPDVTVKLWGRRQHALDIALAFDPHIMASTDLISSVKDADLIVLATPVGVMQGLSESLFSCIKSDATVTDVGSVKGFVHESIGSFFSAHGITFIGSHPMAGSEHQGMEYADPELFTGATCVLTNNEQASEQSVENLANFWQSLGGITLCLDAFEHDSMVARISHLPHAMASLCVNTALTGQNIDLLGKLAAGGFRDTTRVAMGEPNMWSEILLENKEAMLTCLSELKNQLNHLESMIVSDEKDNLAQWLTSAAQMRAQALDLNE